QLFTQQLRRVFFDQDLRLELQAGGEAQVFVGRAREAVDAAVLATAVGIDARVETDVGTVVVRDDAARRVAQEDRVRRRLLLGLVVADVFDRLEAVLRI